MRISAIIKYIGKRIMPATIQARIKLCIAHVSAREFIAPLKRQRAGTRYILFGTPVHDNLGDHLIAEAEIQYLSGIAAENQIYEIPLYVFASSEKKIASLIESDDVILISGGGWMGSLWPYEEKLMQKIIKDFNANKVIVLPQTVYYDMSDTHASELLSVAKSAYRSCSNLTICLREQKSYDFALSHFSDTSVNIMLLPDIALLHDQKSHEETVLDDRKEICLCLRDDREKTMQKEEYDYMLAAITGAGCTYRKIDTKSEKFISPARRDVTVGSKLEEFAQASIVITDRLHGMIYSVLAGTPCIIIDNKTSKVRGVYQTWLYGNENIVLLENVQRDFQNTMQALMKKKRIPYSNKEYIEHFIPLKGRLLEN